MARWVDGQVPPARRSGGRDGEHDGGHVRARHPAVSGHGQRDRATCRHRAACGPGTRARVEDPTGAERTEGAGCDRCARAEIAEHIGEQLRGAGRAVVQGHPAVAAERHDHEVGDGLVRSEVQIRRGRKGGAGREGRDVPAAGRIGDGHVEHDGRRGARDAGFAAGGEGDAAMAGDRARARSGAVARVEQPGRGGGREAAGGVGRRCGEVARHVGQQLDRHPGPVVEVDRAAAAHLDHDGVGHRPQREVDVRRRGQRRAMGVHGDVPAAARRYHRHVEHDRHGIRGDRRDAGDGQGQGVVRRQPAVVRVRCPASVQEALGGDGRVAAGRRRGRRDRRGGRTAGGRGGHDTTGRSGCGDGGRTQDKNGDGSSDDAVHATPHFGSGTGCGRDRQSITAWPRTGGSQELRRREPGRGCRARDVRCRSVRIDHTAAALSSSRLRVRFESTGMPGPMVVAKVILRRYLPLAADGLARSTSSSAAA